MGRIIAVANQKGGVGKTTTAVNLSAALGEAGKSVLLVDADPQGNSTSGYGVDKRSVKLSSYDLMTGEATAAECAVPTEFAGVALVPGSIDLAGADLELAGKSRRESRLKSALAGAREEYDFTVIDCPPTLGLVTLNALTACDTLLIPVQCEYYALEGLSQLMGTARQVKRLYNPGLELEGVLLTMYDGRLNLTQQVVGEIKRFFGKRLFSTVIPRSVRLSEAPSFGKPVLYYDGRSKGAEAYRSLAKEILNKG